MAKGPDAFRTISEAADEIGVGQHVLRFWETRFTFVRPMKRAGGRRFYRPADIALLRTVRRLLHEEGHTIKSVQKLHREQGIRNLAQSASLLASPTAPPSPGLGAVSPDPDARRRLARSLLALEAAKARLDALLARR